MCVRTAEIQKLGVTCIPKLALLPPTTETFTKKAELQTSLEECIAT